MMKRFGATKIVAFFAVAGLAIGVLVTPAQAHIRVGVGIGFGFPVYGYGGPVYPYPAYDPYYYGPGYYAPPPVAYYPAPTYYPAPAAQPVQQAAPATTNYDTSNCRQYSSEQTIDGRPQHVVGTACRQSDGNWRIVQ